MHDSTINMEGVAEFINTVVDSTAAHRGQQVYTSSSYLCSFQALLPPGPKSRMALIVYLFGHVHIKRCNIEQCLQLNHCQTTVLVAECYRENCGTCRRSRKNDEEIVRTNKRDAATIHVVEGSAEAACSPHQKKWATKKLLSLSSLLKSSSCPRAEGEK